MNATNTIENLFSKKKPNWVKKCRLVLLLLVFTFMQDEITKITLSHGFAILQNCYSGKGSYKYLWLVINREIPTGVYVQETNKYPCKLRWIPSNTNPYANEEKGSIVDR